MMGPWVRRAQWRELFPSFGWGSSLAAVLLLALGLFPGPTLALRHDPGMFSDVVVHFANSLYYWIGAVFLIVGTAVVLANTAPEYFDRAWTSERTWVRNIPASRFLLSVASFAALAALAASTYALSRSPTSSDEISQLFHARILLTGRLSLSPDPNPEFFAIDDIIDRGRWYSQFPIGGPAFFAIWILLRSAWLANAVLAALTVVNVYRFASRAYGEGAARVGAILTASSPFVLLMSGSYMNNTLVLYLASSALAELPTVLGGTASRRRLSAIIMGTSVGAAVAVRPLDGAVAAAVFGGFVAVESVRKRDIAPVLWAAVAGAIPIGLLLLVNWRTTGAPLLFGYEVQCGANHSLGFHDDPSGNPHTPTRGLVLVIKYLMQLNWSLFEWPVPGLLIVSAGLLLTGKLRSWDRLLVTWIGLQIVAYGAYWHSGLFLGPRYLFTVVPAFLLIAARGILIAESVFSAPVRRSVVAAGAACILSSWTIPMTPSGAIGEAVLIRSVRGGLKTDLDSVRGEVSGQRALIFVRETASTRLLRRLWGLGVSRPLAARLFNQKDHCALLEAVSLEERQKISAAERAIALAAVKPYVPVTGYRVRTVDPGFRITDSTSITPRCTAELNYDASHGPALAYGPALLRNEITRDGRIGCDIVFVADLGDHNQVLRSRFGDRPWYRLQLRQEGEKLTPQLIPYE